MKERRHHNNKGLRQIQRGKTRDQVKAMVKRVMGPWWREKKGAMRPCRY